VTSASAICGLPLRNLQIALHRSNVEIIQNGSVMEQRSPSAALCVTGHFPLTYREIAEPTNLQVRQSERFHDATQKEAVTVIDISQLRPRLERQKERIIQAAAPNHYRSSPADAA
jgi:predicted molibdopterin-dependent oxidoreductase YjgC